MPPIWSGLRAKIGEAGLWAGERAAKGWASSGKGWGAAIAHDVVNYSGMALGGISRMSNVGLASLAGGIAGGAYGAISDNYTVMGGAMRGAAIGAGGAYGYGVARTEAVRAAWNNGAAGGLLGAFGGAGRAAFERVTADAHSSAALIGHKFSRAYNTVLR